MTGLLFVVGESVSPVGKGGTDRSPIRPEIFAPSENCEHKILVVDLVTVAWERP